MGKNPLFCLCWEVFALKEKRNTVGIATEIAAPVLEKLGLSLWDVRFEKEGSTWFLRYFIDKPGGVTIDDCESFSRAVDPLLDAADPIEQSYCLEVSSPGTERELVRPEHFAAYLGREVHVRFIRPRDGLREFDATLLGYEGNAASLRLPDGREITAAKSETASIRLVDNYDDLKDDNDNDEGADEIS